jgi:hypothetical protein
MRRLLSQWQDGMKVIIVWPEELAPGQPRFLTPPGKSAAMSSRRRRHRRPAATMAPCAARWNVC